MDSYKRINFTFFDCDNKSFRCQTQMDYYSLPAYNYDISLYRIKYRNYFMKVMHVITINPTCSGILYSTWNESGIRKSVIK